MGSGGLKKGFPWKYAEGYHDIASTPQDVPDLENDRGRPNLPKTYRLYNK